MSKALGSGSQWTWRGLNAPSSTEPFTLPPARKRAAGRDQRSALRGHSPLCTVAASSPRARPPVYALLGPRVPARTEPEPGKYLWAEPRIAQPGLRDPGRLGPGPVQQVWAGPPVPARRLRASPGARGAPSQAGPGPVGRVSFHHPQSMRARVHITLPPPLLGSWASVLEYTLSKAVLISSDLKGFLSLCGKQGRGTKGKLWGLRVGDPPCRSCAEALGKLLDSVPSSRHFIGPSGIHAGPVEIRQEQPLSRGKILAITSSTVSWR